MRPSVLLGVPMASFWSATVNNSIADGRVETYEFIEIGVPVQLQQRDSSNNADQGIFLTNYHDTLELAGNEYVSDILKEVGIPPVSGTVTQEIQSLIVGQQLADFGDPDLYVDLGPLYHQAPLIVTSYPVDASGTLHTNAADAFYRAEGIITQVARDVPRAQLQIEFSNSFGQLTIVRELRTTTGSLKRLSTTDSSFDRASSLNPTVSLAWGTKN